ncbi:hypothetical protein GYMLUDRAFT_39862 [Collybiopsis luxurians FD-317 M1]|nr:hypothetical protein GYMLUDRAFT_39862 [Collybiopsis luxurians FD-317 M1]
MSIVKLVIGICTIVHGIEVLAVPQQITTPAPATVTAYNIIPTGPFEADTSIDGTIVFATSVVGVSSGSDGSETTYALGEYISENEVSTSIGTNSQGQIVTETVKTPYFVGNFNWTAVVSEGGAWETDAPTVYTYLNGATGHEVGFYASCSYDGSHQSASCTEVELNLVVSTTTVGSEIATVTGTESFSFTFGGSLSPLTVISQTQTASPSRTGSESTAVSTAASTVASTAASTGTPTGTPNAATRKQVYGLAYFLIFVTVILNL